MWLCMLIGHVCMWSSSLLQSLLEGYKGILFVLTLIARSGQWKPCNPTAITTGLIDSIGTERERARDQATEKERERWKGRSLLLCPSLEFITYCLVEENNRHKSDGYRTTGLGLNNSEICALCLSLILSPSLSLSLSVSQTHTHMHTNRDRERKKRADLC